MRVVKASPEQFEKFLGLFEDRHWRDGDPYVALDEHDEVIGGFGIKHDEVAKNRIWVNAMRLSTDQRGRGYGSQMLGWIATAFPTREIVLGSYPDRIAFYERAGFNLIEGDERENLCLNGDPVWGGVNMMRYRR